MPPSGMVNVTSGHVGSGTIFSIGIGGSMNPPAPVVPAVVDPPLPLVLPPLPLVLPPLPVVDAPELPPSFGVLDGLSLPPQANVVATGMTRAARKEIRRVSMSASEKVPNRGHTLDDFSRSNELFWLFFRRFAGQLGAEAFNDNERGRIVARLIASLSPKLATNVRRAQRVGRLRQCRSVAARQ